MIDMVNPGADDVSTAVAAMVEAVNGGRFALACAAFTEDAVIVEDIAPFRWEGPGAAAAWLGAMGENAQKLGATRVAMVLGPAARVEVWRGRAYAIHPGVLNIAVDQGSLTSEGQLTFTLVEHSGAWLIQTLVWTGPEPSFG